MKLCKKTIRNNIAIYLLAFTYNNIIEESNHSFSADTNFPKI